MKKVFFIGKFNDAFEEIKTYLAQFFSVQVCVDNLSVMLSVLKLSQPDILVLNTTDMGETKEEFIKALKENFSHIPLISLEMSMDTVGAGAFGDLSKFRALIMPVDNDKLVQTICNMLALEYDGDNNKIITSSNEKKCVLAIDDNGFQLRMLNELLKDTYEVQTATSVMKALTMIGKKVPDLILLDYEMPICDGKMAFQMLKEVDEVKDVPIIFLTGVRDAAHINAVLSLHPAGYILKPAKSDVLLDDIEKHIR